MPKYDRSQRIQFGAGIFAIALVTLGLAIGHIIELRKEELWDAEFIPPVREYGFIYSRITSLTDYCMQSFNPNVYHHASFHVSHHQF